MSGAWWTREAGPRRRALIVAHGVQPELIAGSRAAIAGELAQRVPSYTPAWTNARAGDAGHALVRLFSEQMEPVLRRLNRLPEKAFVEFLGMAGVSVLPATPAKALVEFEVAANAPAPVQIAAGFQLGARPAGAGDMVIFETERTLHAAPGKIAEMHTQRGAGAREIDFDVDPVTGRFLPFGAKADVDSALLIGIEGEAAPGPFLSLGISVASAAGTTPPASAGAIEPLPLPAPPLLQWDVLDGTTFEPAAIESDATAGLTRSGVVELRLPRRWRPGRPRSVSGDKELRWLRLSVLHGEYREAPQLTFIRLNMVSAVAARTIFDEVLQPAAGGDLRRWQLSQTPVLPDTLHLVVDEGGLIGETEEQAGENADMRWQAVADLGDSTPEQRHYVLDPASGTITFGDGVHGRAVPPGFRHVRALRYQVGGGAAGAAAAEGVSTLLGSAPFVTGVKNPLPASGGTDRETQAAAVGRGPQEIRARGRAVTLADYALLAQRAPGARVARAHAVAGLHPSYPGAAIPGVVGVFVVPPAMGDGVPTPDQDTLRSVADYFASAAAPAGVEVVAAAPRYHRVRVEAGLVIEPAANPSETVRAVTGALETYLHPLTGGEQAQGWPFGGTLVYSALLRLVAATRGVHAVARLNVVVDGFRVGSCVDYAISPHALLWSDTHQVLIVGRERA